ncbi:hypothetical protein OAG68_02865 [bacterium]|nr:hypothetical protein [bacterium]
MIDQRKEAPPVVQVNLFTLEEIMNQTNMSESQAIKIATEYAARLGLKGFYIEFAIFDDAKDQNPPFAGGYWCVPVGFDDDGISGDSNQTKGQ